MPEIEDKPAEFSSGDGPMNDILTVEDFDLCAEDNAVRHHTIRFHTVRQEKNLVVRRGKHFTVKVQFNRPYNHKEDTVIFHFGLADVSDPKLSRGTLRITPLLQKEEKDEKTFGFWHALQTEAEGKTLVAQITTQVDSFIGQWRVGIETKLKSHTGREKKRFESKKKMFLIFNPWNKADPTFVGDPSYLEEYVLNDFGLIWRGTDTQMSPSPWKFGQYAEHVLECCILLLSAGGNLKLNQRGNPVDISRHISSVVNSVENLGVLLGTWDNIEEGTPPDAWTGSAPILQEYYRTRTPVKFAQCWVFAGVTTTVCRALGLACRPVTNYMSAHDTQGSLTLDWFYDGNGNPIEGLNDDSIWNFHVWNEVWMGRPDIGSEYSGWQVIDATPQEESGGLHQCGPASVIAVSKGEIMKPFDSAFVFSEVNAYKLYWRYRGLHKPMKLMSSNKKGIGVKISTKQRSLLSREDVTENYKHELEGEEQLQAAIQKALSKVGHEYTSYFLQQDEGHIKISVEPDGDLLLGHPFKVKLLVKNESEDKSHVVRVIMRTYSATYNGRNRVVIKEDENKVTIEPKSEKVLPTEISYKEYSEHLRPQATLITSVFGHVTETDFEMYYENLFHLAQPSMKFKTSADIKTGVETEIEAFFINPLPIPIPEGVFLLEMPRQNTSLVQKLSRSIDPEQEARVIFKVSPQKQGENYLMVKFSSRVLRSVEGFITFTAK